MTLSKPLISEFCFSTWFILPFEQPLFVPEIYSSFMSCIPQNIQNNWFESCNHLNLLHFPWATNFDWNSVSKYRIPYVHTYPVSFNILIFPKLDLCSRYYLTHRKLHTCFVILSWYQPAHWPPSASWYYPFIINFWILQSPDNDQNQSKLPSKWLDIR